MQESPDHDSRIAVGGRVALVTGAGRGIGRAVAIALAARGYRVMAVSRTETELRDLSGETGAEYLVESVATSAGCERIIEQTCSRLGPIEILVNNAGVLSAAERQVWDEDPGVWHEIFATNLHGPFRAHSPRSPRHDRAALRRTSW